jgi:twitching motility protein PilT
MQVERNHAIAPGPPSISRPVVTEAHSSSPVSIKMPPTESSGPGGATAPLPSHPPKASNPAAQTFSIAPQKTQQNIPAQLDSLLRDAREKNASDLHISADNEARMRAIGRLEPLGEVLSSDQVEELLRPILDERQTEALKESGYADFALELDGIGRVRVNVNRQRTGLKGCFRLIAERPSTLEELGLPDELRKITNYHQGLVVVSGPNGQGKTTTMASLVDLVNAERAYHIITVEDPVEVLHPIKKAVLSQRQVGEHTNSFYSALKGALREDPDVIIIGELRDKETVEMFDRHVPARRSGAGSRHPGRRLEDGDRPAPCPLSRRNSTSCGS